MTISGTITMYIIIIQIRIGIYHGFFSENFSSIGSRCEFHLLYIKLRTGTIFDIYYVIIYIIIHLYMNSGIKTQVKINRDVDNSFRFACWRQRHALTYICAKHFQFIWTHMLTIKANHARNRHRNMFNQNTLYTRINKSNMLFYLYTTDNENGLNKIDQEKKITFFCLGVWAKNETDIK